MKGCLKIFGVMIAILLLIPIISHILFRNDANYVPNTLYTSPDQDFTVVFPASPKKVSLGKDTIWVAEYEKISYLVIQIKSDDTGVS